MDQRIRDFVETVAQTIVGLDVALFFQTNPSTFDTPAGISLRTHRRVEEVKPALERLADYGVLERHPRGEGKYICYALVRETSVWDLLCRVSETYLDDPHARKEIIRILMSLHAQARDRNRRAAQEGGDQV